MLLKGYDCRGFRFFTNYNSRKGKDIVRFLVQLEILINMPQLNTRNFNIKASTNVQKNGHTFEIIYLYQLNDYQHAYVQNILAFKAKILFIVSCLSIFISDFVFL